MGVIKKFIKNFGWLELILGALFVALGVYTFMNPGIALSWIVVFYSIVAIANGVVNIVFYFKFRRHTGRGPLISLISGIISALMGIVFLFNPFLGRWIFSIIFPIWFIAHSISRIANSGVTHEAAGAVVRIVSIVLNSFGIVLGVLMLLNPILSSLSLGYLVAVNLLLLGIDSVSEAFFRVRGKDISDTDLDIVDVP